jgi:hypothetical protein
MCDDLVDFSLVESSITLDKVDQELQDRGSSEQSELIVTDSNTLVLSDVKELSKSEQIFTADEYDMLFNFETTSRYKAYRIKMQDPITCENLTDNNAFKFKYVWDCLTGERIGVDPYGPLYISPVSILRSYYHNVLKGMWIEFDDCVPMYGENLGTGDNFYIPGKGVQPEKYLFRLPIQDCYVYKEQDNSIHTMGPKLTDEELQEVDNLICKYWYDDPFIEDMPESALSTLRLKKYYDVAICAKPTIDIDALPLEIRNTYLNKVALGHIGIDHDTYLNRLAVDKIKEMIGYRSRFDYF